VLSAASASGFVQMKMRLYEMIFRFGHLVPAQLGNALRRALIMECENVENSGDMEVVG
jgi:hypothetical protein